MRAFQIFAAMSNERVADILKAMGEESPGILMQAVQVAAATMNARPAYLNKLPFDKKATAIRRALARVTANEIAEEILAVYFLQVRKEMLAEWLDALGLEHEEGILKQGNPGQPPEEGLRATIKSFLAGDGPEDRLLLLQTFGSQNIIDWPVLDEVLET
ncbi:MAG: hypothetical protein JRC77_07355 [Deltaproteobacteria bacterium]|nr:hypothetical protein [Deltaproteobacteria bacterium]